MRTQSHYRQSRSCCYQVVAAIFCMRLRMCLWKERIILQLCLGAQHNTLQLCTCLFCSYDVGFVSRKYQIHVLKYSGFTAPLFHISRVPHPELCLETAFSRMRRQHQGQLFHMKRCISPFKNLAMLLQAEIQILDCCFTRQQNFFPLCDKKILMNHLFHFLKGSKREMLLHRQN